MIEIRRAKFRFASMLMDSQYSKQLKAMSMMSWFKSRCWDFSFVNITMKDFIKASRNSLFCFEYSDCKEAGMNERPDCKLIWPVCDSDWSSIVFEMLLFCLGIFSLLDSDLLLTVFNESTEFFCWLLTVRAVLSTNFSSSLVFEFSFREASFELTLTYF